MSRADVRNILGRILKNINDKKGKALTLISQPRDVVTIQCENGHIFQCIAEEVSNGKWCSMCFHEANEYLLDYLKKDCGLKNVFQESEVFKDLGEKNKLYFPFIFYGNGKLVLFCILGKWPMESLIVETGECFKYIRDFIDVEPFIIFLDWEYYEEPVSDDLKSFFSKNVAEKRTFMFKGKKDIDKYEECLMKFLKTPSFIQRDLYNVAPIYKEIFDDIAIRESIAMKDRNGELYFPSDASVIKSNMGNVFQDNIDLPDADTQLERARVIMEKVRENPSGYKFLPVGDGGRKIPDVSAMIPVLGSQGGVNLLNRIDPEKEENNDKYYLLVPDQMDEKNKIMKTKAECPLIDEDIPVGAKCVRGYMRVSTAHQAEKRISLEEQRRAIYDLTKVNKYYLKALYADEGISGASFKDRKSLDALLRDLREGEYFVVTNISRLSRRFLDSMNIMETVKAKKAFFISVEQKELDLTTPIGEACFRTMAIFAEMERKIISARIKDSMQTQRQQGKIRTMAPFGLKISKEDADGRKWIEDSEEMEVVKRAQELRSLLGGSGSSKMSYSEIARKLNEEQWKTRFQKNFHPTTVRRLLLRYGESYDKNRIQSIIADNPPGVKK